MKRLRLFNNRSKYSVNEARTLIWFERILQHVKQFAVKLFGSSAETVSLFVWDSDLLSYYVLHCFTHCIFSSDDNKSKYTSIFSLHNQWPMREVQSSSVKEHRFSLDLNSLQKRHARFGRFVKTPPPNATYAHACLIHSSRFGIKITDHDRVNLTLMGKLTTTPSAQ